MTRHAVTLMVVACALASVFAAAPATATSMTHRTIVELIDLSEIILVGRVVDVTDGFDRGVPYTEVTTSVDEAIRGSTGGRYTFRQFGLRAPRETGTGRTALSVSPPGWPRFERGEEVVLFLYRSAERTGLRTTVGLLQGKFRNVEGRYENGIGNRGLFEGVSLSAARANPEERALVSGGGHGVPADEFVSFVRRAVRHRWIENGELRRE